MVAIYCREMFHASRWRNHVCFFSPMVILESGLHVFVRDCITCKAISYGSYLLHDVNCLVVKFFTKVDCD